ncbi:MAG: tetratricopeptide repeat protein, partial [Planctomycetota bacterium]
FGIIGRFGWLLPLGLAGAVLAWSERRSMRVPPGQIGLWALLLTLSIAAFFVFGRFRVSVAVALVPFAGRALAALRGGGVDPGAGSAAGARTWPAAALAFVLGLAFAWWPAPEGLERPVVDTYNSLGVAQRDAGELEAARATFSRASDASPDAGSAAFNLGLVELQLGDVAAAQSAFERAAA